MSEPTRIRCMAKALLPEGRQWKTCIREDGHRERHVWLEAFDVVGRRPIVVTWHGTRSTVPVIGEVTLRGEVADEPTPEAAMSEDAAKLASILAEWSRYTPESLASGSRLIELVWPFAVAEGRRQAAEDASKRLSERLAELGAEDTNRMAGYELHEQAGQIQLLRDLLVDFTDLAAPRENA
jgi:hypothetical protein